MEKIIKMFLLTLLSLLALMLVGSARNRSVPQRSSDASQAALAVAEQLLPDDRDNWEQHANTNPLWLVQVSMLPQSR